MIALRLTRQNHMELQELPTPVPTGDQVLIKTIYAGVCGTDLHAYHGQYAKTNFPVVLGHELSGLIAAVGPQADRFKPGDRVTCETAFGTCGICPSCKTGDYNLCAERVGLGTKHDGAFAQYVLMPQERVHLLPQNTSLLSGALCEPLACATHAVLEKALVKPGETVCIFGAGAIGLMVAQVALAAGAKVIAAGIPPDRERLDFLTRLGACAAVDQSRENLDDAVRRFAQPDGANAAFECSGALHALHKAFEVVCKKGRVIQMGVFTEQNNAVPTDLLLHKEIAYIGSRSQKPSSWRLAIDLLARDKIETLPLITKVVPLERWQEAFTSGSGAKNLIQCNPEE